MSPRLVATAAAIAAAAAARAGEHELARPSPLSPPTRRRAPPSPTLIAPRAPRAAVYFIIYATAQGIMDAYEEAIEQVRAPRPRAKRPKPHAAVLRRAPYPPLTSSSSSPRRSPSCPSSA